MTSNTPQYTADQVKVLERAMGREAALAFIAAEIDLTEPVTSTPKESKPKPEVKFRTAKQIEAGRETAEQIWARHYAEAGVRRFKDLTPKQQAAAKAEVKAAWSGIKGTRKTSTKK